jgi:hypothetical protein
MKGFSKIEKEKINVIPFPLPFSTTTLRVTKHSMVEYLGRKPT